jgi:hypothetical protein
MRELGDGDFALVSKTDATPQQKSRTMASLVSEKLQSRL